MTSESRCLIIGRSVIVWSLPFTSFAVSCEPNPFCITTTIGKVKIFIGLRPWLSQPTVILYSLNGKPFTNKWDQGELECHVAGYRSEFQGESFVCRIVPQKKNSPG